MSIGVGGDLLLGLADAARHRRLKAISLSVETANPATRLYQGLGFVPVRHTEGDITMILPLIN